MSDPTRFIDPRLNPVAAAPHLRAPEDANGWGNVTSDRGPIDDIVAERERNRKRWGQQDHPSIGPGMRGATACRMYQIPTQDEARNTCEQMARKRRITWADVLLEEFAEAVAAPDDTARRAELVQVAAVALAWIECIDRRAQGLLEEKPRTWMGVDHAAAGHDRSVQYYAGPDAEPSSTRRPPSSAFDHACERAESERRAKVSAEPTQVKWTSLDDVRNRISMRLWWLRNGYGTDLKEFADDVARLMQHVPGSVEVSS